MRPVRVSLLGGVGRFGKNCAVVEVDGFRLGIDCGQAFGPEGPPALPDLDALGRVDAWALTHAHEDHVGALPFAPRAPALMSAYTRAALERKGLALPAPKSLGPLEVELVPVQHSVPGSVAVVVRVDGRALVFSGDLRLGPRPLVGAETDLDALSAAAGPDPLALFCDSTGADHPGDNPGDRSVIAPMVAAARDHPGRVVVATFSSHVERIAVCAEVCRRTLRRLFVLSRGMHANLDRASALDLVEVSDVLAPLRMLSSFPRERQLIVVSGSQAEVNSNALRLAFGEHDKLKLEAGDRFIHSARVIPGFEPRVDEMFAALRARGVEVLDGGEGRHVSGHGYQGDLEAVHAAVAPARLVPVHGADAQLEAHAALGRAGGLEAARARDGDTLIFEGDRLRIESHPLRAFELREGEAKRVP